MKITLKNKEVIIKEIRSLSKNAKNDVIKVTAAEDHLVLQSGNGDIFASKTVLDIIVGNDELVTIFTVEQPGEMLLDLQFLSVLSNLVEDEVVLSVADNALNIRTTSVNLKLNLKSDEVFTPAPTCELKPYLPTLPKSFYTELLQNIGYACESSDKASRPQLRGINLVSNGERLIATGTDSRRAALFNIELKTDEIPSIVVHNKYLSDALSLFSEEEILSEIGNGFLVLKQENVTVYVKLLDGTYPNVAPLFSISEKSFRAQVDVKSLKNVLKLIDSFSGISKEKDDAKKIVRFSAVESGLNVQCIHQGGEFSTVLPIASVTGTLPETFNVNVQFLKEAIATGNETIILTFDGPKLYVSTVPSLQQVIMGTRI